MPEPRKPSKRAGRPPPRGRGSRSAPARARPTLTPASDDAARDRACHTLSQQVRRFPDLEINALRTDDLAPLDGAFAHALYELVVRRWLTLWHLITRALDRPDDRVEPRAAAALLAGAAQILLMDKVPVHAAVNESVEWAKRAGGQGAGRFTNAILRRVADLLPDGARTKRPTTTDARDEIPLADGSALVLSAPVLPEDPLQRLSVATSVPIELLRAWTRTASLREARQWASHSLVSPPVILNTAHADAPLPDGLEPHSAPGHHVYSGTHDRLAGMLAARRDLWVQDPGSSLAVSSVSDLRPTLVVDPCAGMGTKTRQLAATFPDARIVASDIDRLRLGVLRKAVDPTRVTVVEHPRLIDFAGKADLVLLDVPCSNTGVLARRVEARYRFDRARLEELTRMQRQIIADSIRLLRPGRGGARILYSTCSVDPSENHEQAMWATRWHSFNISREKVRAPSGQPGDPATGYSDGSFAVLLA